MKKLATITAIVAIAFTTGCATKRYGRVQPLTGAEMTAYTCREVDLEIAKVESFQRQIAEGAEFNAASALGILGDFGIGNSMERSSAEKSAAVRLGQLRDLRAQKSCGATTVGSLERKEIDAAVASAAWRHGKKPAV